MPKRRSLISVLLVLVVGASEAVACSAVLLQSGDEVVVGFNENWKLFPGWVVVNRRGRERRHMSWEALLKLGAKGELIDPPGGWKATHGSVTFNCFGEHYPIYGVNERGLFIAELYLKGTRTFERPGRPLLFFPLWIQYQLDNYGSVDEVLAAVESGPLPQWWPGFDGSHFFVSDATGAAAEIAFAGGKIKVTQAKRYRVLCNADYTDERNRLSTFKGFGGTRDFDLAGNEGPLRFVKAAHLIHQHERAPNGSTNEGVWGIINRITPGSWQMVFNAKERRIYYRTDANKSLRWIDMNRIDFTQHTTLAIDVNGAGNGDQTGRLSHLSSEGNDSVIREGLRIGYTNQRFLESPQFKHLCDGLKQMPSPVND